MLLLTMTINTILIELNFDLSLFYMTQFHRLTFSNQLMQFFT